MTTKIDGWCAWHPERGYFGDGMALSRTADEAERRVISSLYCKQLETDLAACQKEFDDAGWQIKPVCLLDPARLEALKEWAKEAALRFSWLLADGTSDDAGIRLILAKLDAITQSAGREPNE